MNRRLSAQGKKTVRCKLWTGWQPSCLPADSQTAAYAGSGASMALLRALSGQYKECSLTA